MTLKLTHVVTILCTACALVFAKDHPSIPGSFNLNLSKYGFIDTTMNTIRFPMGGESFEPFFRKLDTLVFENRGQVKILHIGGSHLQADIISGRIREHLIKEYPGASAGRGFVFPYSAARTNTPSSYASYYKGIWDMNRNVQKEVTKPLGLLGIAISTSDPRAEITLLLDKYNRNPMWGETRIRLFGYSDNGDVLPILHVDTLEILGVPDKENQSFVFTPPRPIDTIQISFLWKDSIEQAKITKLITDSIVNDSIAKANADTIKKDSSKKDSVPITIKDTLATQSASADSMFQGDCNVNDALCLAREEQKNKIRKNNLLITSKFDTTKTEKPQSRPRFTLTGILTETDYPGITYTNVGINGARVHDYFTEICPQLEKELAYYKPDLVIFAIGINDANVEHFNDKRFREDYEQLIKRMLKVNPNAALLFETNNDSFRKVKKKRYVQHPNGEVARKSFYMLAEKYKAGIWDKFSIMGGLGSMAKWEKANLAKSDKVHFKLAGYNLLGDMFYKALIKAYQEHIANLPAQEPISTQETVSQKAPQEASKTKNLQASPVIPLNQKTNTNQASPKI